MKKILSTLTVLALGLTSATSVIACSNNEHAKQDWVELTPPSDTAQAIANKIKNKKLFLPALTNQDTALPSTIKALKTALQKANASLTADNLEKISFLKTNLKDNEQLNQLQANIQTGSTKALIKLTVSIHATASQIKNKITAPTTTVISIRANSNTRLNNAKTQKAIKEALQKKYNLSAYDISSIYIVDDPSTAVLKDNEQDNPVILNIIDDDIKKTAATVTLSKVQIHSTALQIANKITNPSSTVIAIAAGSNPRLSNKNTQTAIRKALQTQYSLSDYDTNSATITFPKASSTTLKDNAQDNRISLKITDDAKAPTSANLTLAKVQIHTTALQIANKITNKALVLKAKTNPDSTAPATITTLKNTLATLNPSLTADNLTKISFAAMTLKDNEQTNYLLANITVDTTQASVWLTVSIHSTATQIKTKLIQAGRLEIGFLNTNLAQDKLTAPNIAKILPILKTNNPQLSSWDETQLSIDGDATKTLTAESEVDVTLKIKDDASPAVFATTILKVVRFISNSNQYQVYLINNKIGPALIVGIPAGSSPDASDPATFNRIKKALQTANPALTNNDLTKIFYETQGTSLTDQETNNTVEIKIEVSTYDIVFNLTKVQIHRTANQIKTLINNIPNQNITIAGPGGKTGTRDINAQIKAQIKLATPSLTTWDLTTITIPANKKISTSYLALTVSITDDASPRPDFVDQIINVKATL